MQFNDFLSGYLKSGGWRFGGQQPGQVMPGYTPEQYNGGLLSQVGNPFKKGAVDAALTKTPVTETVATGLLSRDGGRDVDRSGGRGKNGTNFTDQEWGTIKSMNDYYGFAKNPVNQISMNALKDFVMSPVAAILSANEKNKAAIQSVADFQNGFRDQGLLGAGAAGYLSSIGMPTNSSIAMMSQQDMDALNRDIASWAGLSGNDSYSGQPGGGSSGGSYAGGDYGYSGEGRGDYF